MKELTLPGARRKVPKSAIFVSTDPLVCAENNSTSEHIFSKSRTAGSKLWGTVSFPDSAWGTRCGHAVVTQKTRLVTQSFFAVQTPKGNNRVEGSGVGGGGVF